MDDLAYSYDNRGDWREPRWIPRQRNPKGETSAGRERVNLGRLDTSSDGQGVTDYGYHPLSGSADGAGELAEINGPWADDTIRYAYDPLGRQHERKILDDASGVLHSEAIAFGAMGRIDSITDDLGVHATAYDGASSRPLSQTTTLPGQPSTPFLTRSYGWQSNANGARLASLQNRLGAATGSVLSDHAYGYSPAGQITAWNRTLGSVQSDWSIDYDPLGQITGLEERDGGGALTKQWRWTYDVSGNRVCEIEGPDLRHAAIGPANRLERVGGPGSTLVEGTVDEPAAVTVNGQPAALRPLGAVSPSTGETHYFNEEQSDEVMRNFGLACSIAGGGVGAGAIASMPNMSITVTSQAFGKSPPHVFWNIGSKVYHAFGGSGKQTVSKAPSYCNKFKIFGTRLKFRLEIQRLLEKVWWEKALPGATK